MKERSWRLFVKKTRNYANISKRVATYILTEGRIFESAYLKLCSSSGAGSLSVLSNVFVTDEQGRSIYRISIHRCQTTFRLSPVYRCFTG